ncbi:MAG: prepilin peptidase [Phycisphaerae bacterium]|nr:prepilin peptidase [Phycisphaerae bacterium]
MAGAWSDWLALSIATPLIAYGIYTDAFHRRISNRLNLLLLVSGLCAQAALRGLGGLWDGLASCALALGAMVFLYAAGAVGAGDAKFMAAIGAWLWPIGCLAAMAAGILLAGGAGVISIARSSNRAQYVDNLTLIAHKLMSGRIFNSQVASHEMLNQSRRSMPFGAFLGLGGLGTLAWVAMNAGIRS